MKMEIPRKSDPLVLKYTQHSLLIFVVLLSLDMAVSPNIFDVELLGFPQYNVPLKCGTEVKVQAAVTIPLHL